MTYCPVPLRVTLGPCGRPAHIAVERDMGFIGVRVVCPSGHSRMVSLVGVGGTERELDELPKRGPARRMVALRPCARVGCTSLANPGARFCSYRCGAIAGHATRRQPVWPEARRSAFIEDYGGGESLETLAKRYDLGSTLGVTRQAAKFRKGGYAVPYLRPPGGARGA